MKLGPGLTFGWRRAVGVTAARREVARRTGVPTTRAGVERKVGRTVINSILGRRR